MRFKAIGEDVDIHINGGSSYRDASEMVVVSNASAIVDYNYEIDQGSALILTMHSKQDGATKTAYEFEYWTEAENWPWHEMYIPIYNKYLDLNGSQQ